MGIPGKTPEEPTKEVITQGTSFKENLKGCGLFSVEEGSTGGSDCTLPAHSA